MTTGPLRPESGLPAMDALDARDDTDDTRSHVLQCEVEDSRASTCSLLRRRETRGAKDRPRSISKLPSQAPTLAACTSRGCLAHSVERRLRRYGGLRRSVARPPGSAAPSGSSPRPHSSQRHAVAEMTHQGVSSEPWERHTSLHRGEESIAGSSGRLSLAVTGGDPPRPGETPPLQSSHEGATGADIVRIGGVDIYIPACKRPCKRPCPEPGGRAMAATVDRDARAPPSVASISSSNSSNGGGGGEREFHVPATSELHRFNSIASTAVGGAGRGGKSRPRSPCGEGSPELLVGMAGKREGDGGVKAARAIPSNELLGSRGLAPLSKPRLRQMHLDAGQRGFGPAPCPRCGMVYTKVTCTRGLACAVVRRLAAQHGQ